MPFEDALREALDASPDQSRRARKLRDVLDSRPSRRRARIMSKLEAHAEAHVRTERGLVGATDAVGAIDWSKVDWKGILDGLLTILLKVLSVLLLTMIFVAMAMTSAWA